MSLYQKYNAKKSEKIIYSFALEFALGRICSGEVKVSLGR